MAKNRIHAGWLLLLTAIFTASTVMGTGQAQARYQNTVTWNTVVDQTIDSDQVSSDCLENTSKPPVTILLSELMGPPMDVVFYLYSGVPVIGPLNWTTDRPDYVDVTMSIGSGEDLQILQPGDNVEIPEGAYGLKVTMTLTPTDKALGQSHGAMDVNVDVAWSDCLQGTFLTFLPALDLSGLPPLYPEEVDPEETLPEDPTDPIQTEPPETTEPKQPEETQPTEPSQPVEPTETNENEQNQPTEPPADPPEEAAENGQNPDPETQDQPDTLNTAATPRLVAADAPAEREHRTLLENGDPPPSGEGTADEIPGEGTDDGGTSGDDTGSDGTTGEGSDGEGTGDGGTDGEENGDDDSESYVPQNPEVKMQSLQTFKTDSPLPVRIVTAGPMSTVELGMGFRDKGEEGMEPINFPKYTRYSLDGGLTYYMLYHPGPIALTPTNGAELFLLLDFSRVELSGNQVDLAVACYDAQGKTVAAHKLTTTAQKQYAVSAGSRILTPTDPLEIVIPQSWQGYVLEYEVRVLTSPQLADGTYGPQTYEIVELSEEGLFGELTENGNLQLQLGQNLPRAGCYQINLFWKSGETVAEEAQILFYINYSANKEILKTGGAEQ